MFAFVIWIHLGEEFVSFFSINMFIVLLIINYLICINYFRIVGHTTMLYTAILLAWLARCCLGLKTLLSRSLQEGSLQTIDLLAGTNGGSSFPASQV